MARRSLQLATLWLILSLGEAQLSFPRLTTSTDGGASATATGGASTVTTTGTDGSAQTTTVAGGTNYPIPTVPPTDLAPFMQKSHLPQNFVFIVVGSIIGFCFVVVFLWRAAIAWSVKRNAKRANFPYYGVKKGGLGKLQKLTGMGAGLGSQNDGLLSKPSLPFYGQGLGSDMSLEPLKGRPGHNEANRSSLFFSPTAGVGARAASPIPNKRMSYHPAGYYAAGQPINTAPVTASGRPLSSIGRPLSMLDLTNRSSQHFSTASPKQRHDSPGQSPLLGPRSDLIGQSQSSLGNVSNVSLHARAPSTYLEDLFDADPNGHVPHDRRPEY